MRLELFPLGPTAPPYGTSFLLHVARRCTKAQREPARGRRGGGNQLRLRRAHTEDGGSRRRVPALSATSPAACPHSAWQPRGPGSGLDGAAGIRRRLPGSETRGLRRRRPPRRTKPSRGRERGGTAWFLPQRALREGWTTTPITPQCLQPSN